MASTGEVWRLGRRPALDGVRGIAVLLVVACHLADETLWTLGTTGVTVFFTLSGFLITCLLLEEHHKRGAVSLPRFYARRARRLLPAFLVLLVVIAPLEGMIFGGVPNLAAVLLYSANWTQASGGDAELLLHTWSLAIEEQFYLLWPLLLVGVVRRWGQRGVLVAAAVGSVAAAGWRAALWFSAAGADRVYFGSDTRADALLVGCGLAAWMVGGRHARRGLAWFPALATVGFLLAGPVAPGAVHHVLVPTVVPVVAAVVIWVCVTRGCRWLEFAPLAAIGRRSYGLYLWHYPVTVLLLGWPWNPTGLDWVLSASVAVGVSLMLTELSWRFVERPFTRRRSSDAHPVDCGLVDRPGWSARQEPDLVRGQEATEVVRG